MDNKHLARQFRLLAQLMEFYGIIEFKYKAISAAALRISKHPVQLRELNAEKLCLLEGFSKSIAQKVNELLEKGSLAELEAYKNKTPSGIIELLGIRGLGPKKIHTIWNELSIDNPADLYYACNENRLTGLKGFGTKSQDEIRKLLEFSFKNKGSYLFPAAQQLAEEWLEKLRSLSIIFRAEITGDLRRKNEIIQLIKIIVEATSEADISDYLKGFQNFSETTERSALHSAYFSGTSWSVHEDGSLPIEIIMARQNQFEFDWFLTTGSDEHIRKLIQDTSISDLPLVSGLPQISDLSQIKDLALISDLAQITDLTFNTETEIYAHFGLPIIPPELREGENEIEEAKSGKLKNIIIHDDLRGSIHNHSTYSDGLNSLAEMATACIEMGLEYLAICDHSQSAFYAGGLSIEAIKRQHDEIDLFNIKLSPFKIFKGIESDILSDGSLDYPPEILQTFDLVVASIHSNLRMDKEKATSRLIKAIRNPFTTILGHATGRLLLGREGYQIDHEAVIEACAESGVAIEINANPNRLDIDWRWLRTATDRGIMIPINPDAHSIAGLSDVRYGINAARKGGLLKENCLNALNKEQFSEYLKKRKAKKIM